MKKIILFMIAFFLSLSCVIGDERFGIPPYNGRVFLPLNISSSNVWYGADGTDSSVSYKSSYPSFSLLNDGSEGSGFYSTTGYTYLPDTIADDISGSYTISLWFNTTDGADAAYNTIFRCGYTNICGLIGRVYAGRVQAQQYDGAWHTLTNDVIVDDGLWHHVAITWNNVSNNLSLFVDNTYDGYDTVGKGNNNKNYFRISEDDGGQGLNGQIDHFMMFNINLPPENITALYECGYTSCDIIPLTVSIYYPSNNTNYNTDSIPINFSVSKESNICSLYSNISGSYQLVNTTNTPTADNLLTHNIYLNFSGFIGYYVNCSDDVETVSSNKEYIFYDNINPDPIIHNLANGTMLGYGYAINLSCYDLNLFSFNGFIAYDNYSGIRFNNFSYWNITGTSQYYESEFYGNITGIYFGYDNCSDAHTKKTIKDLSAENNILGNGINYYLDDTVLTERIISSDKNIKSVNFKKESDRITSEYEFTSDGENNIIKEFTCSMPFKIPSNTVYKGHLICGQMWVDSESDDFSIIGGLEQIDAFTYRLNLFTDKSKIKSKSVGIINTVESYYYFYLDYDKPFVYLNTTNSTAFIYKNLDISYTPIDSGGLSNCSFIVNGTFINSQIPSNATENIFNDNLGVGDYQYIINCTDNFGNHNNSEIRFFYIIPEPESSLGFIFDPTSIPSVFLLFVLVFFYMSLMGLGFFFKNFSLLSMGFFIGFIIGLFVGGVSIVFALIVLLLNISLFISFSKARYK